MGISLGKEQIHQFISYLHLLVFWNKKVNLTAIKEEKEMVKEHILDSLSCYNFVKGEKGRIVDVGAGAGFPSIPLLILEPSLHMALLDSSKKKCVFLRQVRRELGLEYRVIGERIEELAHIKGERASYHIALSRALAPLNILLELSLPLLALGGFLVAFKSKDIQREIEESRGALSSLKGEIKEIKKVEAPFLIKERYLLLIESKGILDESYPRRMSLIEKKSL